jgi:ABC-type transporter MlaC component
MSKSNDKWMVISVIADGANDISIKRGEYSDVIKNDGYDALLIKIQKKIDEASN